jgi:hypothetical protein
MEQRKIMHKKGSRAPGQSLGDTIKSRNSLRKQEQSYESVKTTNIDTISKSFKVNSIGKKDTTASLGMSLGGDLNYLNNSRDDFKMPQFDHVVSLKKKSLVKRLSVLKGASSYLTEQQFERRKNYRDSLISKVNTTVHEQSSKYPAF